MKKHVIGFLMLLMLAVCLLPGRASAEDEVVMKQTWKCKKAGWYKMTVKPEAGTYVTLAPKKGTYAVWGDYVSGKTTVPVYLGKGNYQIIYDNAKGKATFKKASIPVLKETLTCSGDFKGRTVYVKYKSGKAGVLTVEYSLGVDPDLVEVTLCNSKKKVLSTGLAVRSSYSNKGKKAFAVDQGTYFLKIRSAADSAELSLSAAYQDLTPLTGGSDRENALELPQTSTGAYAAADVLGVDYKAGSRWYSFTNTEDKEKYYWAGIFVKNRYGFTSEEKPDAVVTEIYAPGEAEPVTESDCNVNLKPGETVYYHVTCQAKCPVNYVVQITER